MSDAQIQLVDDVDLEIYTGTCTADVQSAFALSSTSSIDHVFVGATLGIEKKLEIAREVHALSAGRTSVHLKGGSGGAGSGGSGNGGGGSRSGVGPKGFLPWVKAVLGGLKEPVEEGA